jgi:hypothetical protein
LQIGFGNDKKKMRKNHSKTEVGEDVEISWFQFQDECIAYID